MKFISFGSGSSGNCYYINSDGHGLIIDLGIGIRSFKKYYKDYGLSFGEIQGILVTHNHTDHTKAVGVLSNEFHIPVYSTEAVHEGMLHNIFLNKKIKTSEIKIITHHANFQIGPFNITAFPVPHDSYGNNGYMIETEDKILTIITDIGHITEDIERAINNSNYLIIESNYDPEMLDKGKYPLHLKKRIKSPYGHISNQEIAYSIAKNLNKEFIKGIWLCHLSEENNTPENALKAVNQALYEHKIELPQNCKIQTLPRRTPYGIIEI